MSRAIQTLLLTLGLATAGFAIEPGNSEKEVLATLGKPLMVRTTTAGAIWKYRDGTSVRIEGGVVKEVDGPGAAKDVVRSASGAVVTQAEVAPPPPPVVTPAPKSRPTATPSTNAVSPGASTAPKTNLAVKPTTPPPATNPVRNVKASTDKSPIRYAAPEPPPKPSFKRMAGLGFLGLAMLAIGAGNIWLLIVAFKEHVGWGLACFFIPLAGLIFIITHWADTKKILFFQLGAGVPLLVVGAILMS